MEYGSRNKQVAERTGYSEKTVGNILSGNVDVITERFIQSLCNSFGIVKLWVETGVGPMSTNDNVNAFDKLIKDEEEFYQKRNSTKDREFHRTQITKLISDLSVSELIDTTKAIYEILKKRENK